MSLMGEGNRHGRIQGKGDIDFKGSVVIFDMHGSFMLFYRRLDDADAIAMDHFGGFGRQEPAIPLDGFSNLAVFAHYEQLLVLIENRKLQRAVLLKGQGVQGIVQDIYQNAAQIPV